MSHPDLVIHPGEILLEEFLRPHGLAPSAFAARLGLPANRITGIVNGTRAITSDTALLLGEAFGTSAEFWVNLQQHHDLERARAEARPERLDRARALHATLSQG